MIISPRLLFAPYTLRPISRVANRFCTFSVSIRPTDWAKWRPRPRRPNTIWHGSRAFTAVRLLAVSTRPRCVDGAVHLGVYPPDEGGQRPPYGVPHEVVVLHHRLVVDAFVLDVVQKEVLGGRGHHDVSLLLRPEKGVGKEGGPAQLVEDVRSVGLAAGGCIARPGRRYRNVRYLLGCGQAVLSRRENGSVVELDELLGAVDPASAIREGRVCRSSTNSNVVEKAFLVVTGKLIFVAPDRAGLSLNSVPRV